MGGFDRLADFHAVGIPVMNNALQRSARGSVNRLPCVFALALDEHAAVCGLAAHQEGKTLCSQPLARAHCAQIEGVLQQALRFAVADGKRLHIQVQGLSALHRLLDAQSHAIDVQRLLSVIEQRGGIAAIPPADLLQARNL